MAVVVGNSNFVVSFMNIHEGAELRGAKWRLGVCLVNKRRRRAPPTTRRRSDPPQDGRTRRAAWVARATRAHPNSTVRGVLAHTRGARAPARDGARARAARASAEFLQFFLFFFFFFYFTIFLGSKLI